MRFAGLALAILCGCGAASPEPNAPSVILIPQQPAQVARNSVPLETASPDRESPIASACEGGKLWIGDRCFTIAGSHWLMTTEMPTNDTRTFMIDFEPSGHMVSHDPADTTDDDEWEIDGNHLRFWFNKRYVVYDVSSLTERDMSGTALNVNDLQWPWAAHWVR